MGCAGSVPKLYQVDPKELAAQVEALGDDVEYYRVESGTRMDGDYRFTHTSFYRLLDYPASQDLHHVPSYTLVPNVSNPHAYEMLEWMRAGLGTYIVDAQTGQVIGLPTDVDQVTPGTELPLRATYSRSGQALQVSMDGVWLGFHIHNQKGWNLNKVDLYIYTKGGDDVVTVVGRRRFVGDHSDPGIWSLLVNKRCPFPTPVILAVLNATWALDKYITKPGSVSFDELKERVATAEAIEGLKQLHRMQDM